MSDLASAMAEEVNHPKHYITKGGTECLDVIEDLDMPYHLGNVMKYLWRCGRKNPDPLKDLLKAQYYLNRHIALLQDRGEE